MPDFTNCPKTGEPIDCSSELLDLLAVICGDGGHLVQKFGIRAGIARARAQHYQMREGQDVIARIYRNITSGFDRTAEANAFGYLKKHGVDPDTGKTKPDHVIALDYT